MSKSLKQLSNFTKKSRYRHHSNRLQGCPLSGPCLNCYRFLPFAVLELQLIQWQDNIYIYD